MQGADRRSAFRRRMIVAHLPNQCTRAIFGETAALGGLFFCANHVAVRLVANGT
jgi:hypothetical protein